MATSINEMIAVSQLTEDAFVAVSHTAPMGNTASIAFGGCVLSMAINAGVSSVPAGYYLYAAHGLYLGPSLNDEKMAFVIHRVRETRSFRTLRVEAKQIQKGKERVTFYITLDFQAEEVTVLKYNLPPRMPHPEASEVMEYADFLRKGVQEGKFPRDLVEVNIKSFGLLAKYFEIRQCPEGVSTQNMLGMYKKAKTSQDVLDIHQKSSAHWFKSRSPVSKQESYGALAFVTDAALAFIPLVFRNEFITDYGALSSLDCTLRYHTKDFSCNDWLLHEQVTECGNEGRTYSTGRVFRQDGVLVATMNQMSIIRPKVQKSGTANL